ncbi:hypothetical protein BLOT_011323 [Blomia tropicalis]|nr:hypothetical protein BLOT_011323 [Blomia tropicalis]
MSYTASRWMKISLPLNLSPIMLHEDLHDVSFTTNQSSTKKKTKKLKKIKKFKAKLEAKTKTKGKRLKTKIKKINE